MHSKEHLQNNNGIHSLMMRHQLQSNEANYTECWNHSSFCIPPVLESLFILHSTSAGITLHSAFHQCWNHSSFHQCWNHSSFCISPVLESLFILHFTSAGITLHSAFHQCWNHSSFHQCWNHSSFCIPPVLESLFILHSTSQHSTTGQPDPVRVVGLWSSLQSPLWG